MNHGEARSKEEIGSVKWTKWTKWTHGRGILGILSAKPTPFPPPSSPLRPLLYQQNPTRPRPCGSKQSSAFRIRRPVFAILPHIPFNDRLAGHRRGLRSLADSGTPCPNATFLCVLRIRSRCNMYTIRTTLVQYLGNDASSHSVAGERNNRARFRG